MPVKLISTDKYCHTSDYQKMMFITEFQTFESRL